MHRPRTTNLLAHAMIAAGLLCVLLVVYAVSYLANVAPKRTRQHVTHLVDGRLMEAAFDEVHPEYRIGGPAAAWLFWPAHQLDRNIRLDIWPSSIE